MLNIAESLKRQREQILDDGSEEMLSRHTSLLEIAIISLYNRLVNSLKVDAATFRSSGAVVAMSAFGRGLIAPRQTVSLLILMAESSSWQESWIDEIADPLIEAGWNVEVERGSINRLAEKARQDFAFFLRLLEGRYISGHRQLAEQLDDELEALIDKHQDSFLTELYGSVKAREEQLKRPENWLAPDLIGNPGGLANIGSIRLACRIASHIRCLDDAIFQGYLDRQEVDFLQQAEKKFTRLISLLQSLDGQSEGVLRIEQQELLANQLGYSARVGFLPVETFMQEIYQLLHGVTCISQEFWERLQETRSNAVLGDDVPVDPLETGLVVRQGKIQLQSELYPATAGHLVHLFHLAAKERLGFTNITRQWIHHHRNVLDTAAGSPMLRDELLGIIRTDDSKLEVFRRFYNLRLMTSLIPELAAVHGLVQHDAFHIYPVHEHHLRTLAELKKLFDGEYLHLEPELTKIAQRMEDPTLLFVAALLHDIGKSAGRDHALHGSEMIPSIIRRIGLGPEESDILQFMVAQHLLLMDNASLRDLADEEMLAQCALVIKTPKQLDFLALLSFADLMATGPRAQQKWRDTPVMALYERVSHLLEKGEPSPQAIAERIEQVRKEVEGEVADLIGKVELESYFEQLAPRYLLSMPPGSIAKHLRMEWELQHSEEPFVWEAIATDGLAAVTLLSKEASGLLAKAAGILT
ncbi:MAG: HD domain-containing protein, partial [Desulforhabdus sp.]|nr:HD domain-containing protein [Desulforhabdus sp.]